MKRPALAALLALSSLALAACGGDNGVPITSFPTPTVATQALTKTDYIAQADAVCAEANAALGSLPATDAATLATQKVDISQNLVDQLDALGLPTEDETTLQRYLDAENQILDNQKKIQLAQQRGDTSTTATFTTAISTAEADAKAAAESYGFQECGKGATASATTTTPGAVTTTPAAPTQPTTPPAGTGNGTGNQGGTAGNGGGNGNGGGGNSGGVGAP
ncbi:MAG: hypothetical protein QOG09_823 [Solirubrobacterales bacterium]|jgi:hypothetical protein|nr:hypothetical protein [Solirubrobacterales bacterium]MDX6652660.1 hypothetical protein [Solirubrobacterales bacterium]MDX6662721.1 hypothetical protein [Solirubrobacterales bacterium]